MNALATRLRTFAAIGAANGARALTYRLGLKLGLHPAQRIAATIVTGDAFPAPQSPSGGMVPPQAWRDEALLFGAYRVPIATAPPVWTRDPLVHDAVAATDPLPGDLPPWWQIGDFAAGDIKRVWELSRFDWAMAFAQQARAGEAGALERLNAWIADWVIANPPYRGPNWKCAQEASIRLLHLSIAALLLGRTDQVSDTLRSLLDAHVRRILPTLSYARAQDNNHATSEAAALFVAGAWYVVAGIPGSAQLVRRGRRLLEQHVARLFMPDGSFSQYSMNYHRVALDTLSMAEIWRRAAGLPPFSERFRQRAAAAADWLRIMVDPVSGDAPNLGANDGANLLPLTDADYRDHRPSVQLAMAVFQNARAYPPGPWDGVADWLAVALSANKVTLPATASFDDGGYTILRHGAAMALLRYPRFRFRPSQADAMHVDLWLAGENLLRDGGSYSYNTDQHWIDYFGGVASHNTIQFDSRPQMPRLSRFLLGDWLKTDFRADVADGFTAAYRHRTGWSHHREVRLGTQLDVIDRVDGFTREARLRWRLAPGPWRVEGNSVINGSHRLSVTADVPITSFALVTGWESRRYFEKTELPVLEVVITRPGRIVSEYGWTS